METAAIAFLAALAGGFLAMLGNLIVANRSSEHRIREARYGQVYAKRLELVAELYQKIVQAQSAVEYGIYQSNVLELSRREDSEPEVHGKISDEQHEAQVKAWVRIGELGQFYREHRIYFSGLIASSADRLMPLLGHSLVEGKLDTSEGSPYARLTELRADLEHTFRRALDIPIE